MQKWLSFDVLGDLLECHVPSLPVCLEGEDFSAEGMWSASRVTKAATGKRATSAVNTGRWPLELWDHEIIGVAPSSSGS
jgi:hypothetical protein